MSTKLVLLYWKTYLKKNKGNQKSIKIQLFLTYHAFKHENIYFTNEEAAAAAAIDISNVFNLSITNMNPY